jgi:hypothetical protein
MQSNEEMYHRGITETYQIYMEDNDEAESRPEIALILSLMRYHPLLEINYR